MTFKKPGRVARRPSRSALRTVATALVATALLASACGSNGEPPTPTPSGPGVSTDGTAPAPSPNRDLALVRVELEPVATLEQPLAIAVRPGDPALYVAEKVGRVVALDGGAEPRTVLDLTGQVSLGGEQGLLGIAFSPNGRFLYVDFTDTIGDTRVVEFPFGEAGADVGSRRDVLFVHQPFSNHNGGALAFGPDGYLYVALGDGGSGGDPYGNGQSLSTLLGKILRISPRPSDGRPYGVPKDNPFVGRVGAKPEIWDYGLRNPWRFSFDRETRDLWIGDVGQSAWEEVDVERARSPGGLNFGWNLYEGSHPYASDGPRRGSRCRCSSTCTTAPSVRSPAATCTGGPPSRTSWARTCSATTARVGWRRSSCAATGRRASGSSARPSTGSRRSARMPRASCTCAR